MSYRSGIVTIGNLTMGGDLPVRVQSMTSTDTLDTAGSVSQCIRIIEAGGELVRLTAQGIREAENLGVIRKELRSAGFETPLCADIHFNPAVAEVAARMVEKVRINPGNYADRRAAFIKQEFSESEYNSELGRIRERLLPLIAVCREYGTAIRVGVNHGSLSDRIMTRYGNTVTGMAVSAIEFLEIFRDEGFNSLVVSMKSSDTGVMVESNRMLVTMMMERGMNYPVHLGITEAGEGNDGRIISAAGIGTLLGEGIGDTVRVSLSEAPEKEIPVALEIAGYISSGRMRIKEPLPPVQHVSHTGRYIPCLFSVTGEGVKDEEGRSYTGEVMTFNGDKFDTATIPDVAFSGVLNPVFHEDDYSRLAIMASSLLGRWFIARRAAGLCITNHGSVSGKMLDDIAFSILQATEARITRTRYVSCPTCGRTKFNLEEAVRKVKEATSHLKGLKIAVMGCVVNGPGEMAGADYGYVGSAPGKVNIYRGSEAVYKNIPESDALRTLLDLIEADQASR